MKKLQEYIQIQHFKGEELLIQELLKEQKKITISEYKRVPRQPGIRQEVIKGLPIEIIRCEVDQNEKCPVYKISFKKSNRRKNAKKQTRLERS